MKKNRYTYDPILKASLKAKALSSFKIGDEIDAKVYACLTIWDIFTVRGAIKDDIDRLRLRMER